MLCLVSVGRPVDYHVGCPVNYDVDYHVGCLVGCHVEC